MPIVRRGKPLVIDGKLVTNPECCCEPPCPIYADGFSTNTIPDFWDVRSGTLTVGSGVVTTTSNPGFMVANAESETGHGWATVQAKVSATNGEAEIIGAYVSDSKYIKGQLVSNGASSTWKLFKRSGGVNTQLGPTRTISTSLNTFYTLTICWDGEEASASIGNLAHITEDYPDTGTKAGVRATPSSGSATFDAFDFQHHYVDNHDCPSCIEGLNECDDFHPPVCDDGRVPKAIRVFIDVTFNGGGCEAGCMSIYGSHILHLMGPGTTANHFVVYQNDCYFGNYDQDQCTVAWRRTMTTSCGGGLNLTYDISVIAVRLMIGWVLQGRIGMSFSSGGGNGIGFVGEPLDEPVNCLTDLENVVLEYSCNTGVGGIPSCFDIGEITTMTASHVEI